MLANCGQLGLDPAALSISGYLETLAAHNAAQGGEPAPLAEEDKVRLRRFFSAHRED